MRLVLAGLAALAALGPLACASELSCAEAGFAEGLVCGSCDKLEDIVADAELTAECRRCCVDERAASTAQFSSAVLEVCQ